MKTRIALILAILMLILCAAGCKAKTAPAAEATPASTEAPATEAPTEVPATEAPTEAPVVEHPDTELPEISRILCRTARSRRKSLRRGTTSRLRWIC